MAQDKSVDSTLLTSAFRAEADAIRAKTGNTAALAYDLTNGRGFASAISAIITPADIPRAEDEAY